MQIRPARVRDRDGVEEMVARRVRWMDERGLSAVVHHRQHPGLARIGMFFLARQWSGEPVVGEPDKAGKLVWADPRVLPSNTIAYPAEGIQTWGRGDRLALHGWPTP